MNSKIQVPLALVMTATALAEDEPELKTALGDAICAGLSSAHKSYSSLPLKKGLFRKLIHLLDEPRLIPIRYDSAAIAAFTIYCMYSELDSFVLADPESGHTAGLIRGTLINKYPEDWDLSCSSLAQSLDKH